VLIAVEGAGPAPVAEYQDAIVEHVRAVGYRAVAERTDDTWPAPPSFSAPSFSARSSEAPRTVDGSAGSGSPAGPPGLNGSRSGGGPGPRVAPQPTPASALRTLAALSDRVSGSIRPDLELGSVVVSTDYVDAVVVRHGVSGGLDEEQVLLTALWAVEGLLPDLTVLVDGGLVEADGALATGPPEADDGDVDLATADVGPLDERTGYRNRASTAPERYVLVSGPIPAQGELDVELAGRIDSVLRLRAPALSDPVIAGTAGPRAR
jgi:hypothetical protein